MKEYKLDVDIDEFNEWLVDVMGYHHCKAYEEVVGIMARLVSRCGLFTRDADTEKKVKQVLSNMFNYKDRYKIYIHMFSMGYFETV